MKFQSMHTKQKQKFPPKFDKILGCYNEAPEVTDETSNTRQQHEPQPDNQPQDWN
jgi:hypothetical protein